MLNDNEDGDYGSDWWLIEKGYTKGLYSAFWWWWRNPVWNFKHLIRPKAGPPTIYKVFSNDVRSPLGWVLQYDRGTNHAYFKIAGTIYGRFSYTNDLFNLMMGAETRYIFKLRRSK